MRTHQQLLAEIQIRKVLGLPRIELTPEERTAAFGDTAKRDPYAYEKSLVERLQSGLPMSISAKRMAKQFLKTQKDIS